jgi:hypothetical protein
VRPGRTELGLAVESARLALDDAGIEQPDAMLSYHLNDSARVLAVARRLRLRLPRLGWHNEIYCGGTQSAPILGDAAMLIDAGLAETVLVYRALNGRSGRRLNALGLRLGRARRSGSPTPMAWRGRCTSSRWRHSATCTTRGSPTCICTRWSPGPATNVHGLDNVAEAVRRLRAGG